MSTPTFGVEADLDASKTYQSVIEFQVRKAALQSVSTMLTSAAAASCLGKTEVEYITQRCLEEGKINQEFIREVDLGPFKHKVDDGLPVRKMAFLVLSDLVAAFPQEVLTHNFGFFHFHSCLNMI